MTHSINPTPQPAGAIHLDPAQCTAMAMRTVINELRRGTVRHPDTADICLTRFEEQLGVGPTVPVEPPVNGWTQVPIPVTVSAACQQFRNRIDDAKFGQADWEACDRLLDWIEAKNGWPRSCSAIELQLGRHTTNTEATRRENTVRRTAIRKGYRVVKSKARNPFAPTHGTYMILDNDTNTVAFEGNNTAGGGFGLSLEDVEDWLDESPRNDCR